jgi:hypothetical protein
MNISREAKSALINVGVSRRGATLPTTTPDAVVLELLRGGMVGKGLGLTDHGVVCRTAVVDQAMDF